MPIFPPFPTQNNLSAYSTQIISRFNGNQELASDFVDKSLGHQHDKSNGLIAFNALLAAIVAAQPTWFDSYFSGAIAFFCLGFSSLLMMPILYSIWAEPTVYSAANIDLSHSLKIVVYRSWALNISVIFTTIALFIVFGFGACHQSDTSPPQSAQLQFKTMTQPSVLGSPRRAQ